MKPAEKIIFLSTLFIFGFTFLTYAQRRTDYNLVKMLGRNMLDTTKNNQLIKTFFNPKNQAISAQGTLWLKGVDFKEGTIDVDLRGKNTFLQSFMGIAFHAKDTTTYEVVYFCPFRFRDTNAVARKWGVKYMSMPDNDYLKLRKEHPGVYENSVEPAPRPNDWIHATIVVKDDWITIFVNHSPAPSLKVKKLPGATSGKIGLWSPDLESDFENLTFRNKRRWVQPG